MFQNSRLALLFPCFALHLGLCTTRDQIVIVLGATFFFGKTHLPAGYFMKSGMKDLRFFDLLHLHWMEGPKKLVGKRKITGRFWQEIEIIDQILAFLTKMSIF